VEPGAGVPSASQRWELWQREGGEDGVCRRASPWRAKTRGWETTDFLGAPVRNRLRHGLCFPQAARVNSPAPTPAQGGQQPARRALEREGQAACAPAHLQRGQAPVL